MHRFAFPLGVHVVGRSPDDHAGRAVFPRNRQRVHQVDLETNGRVKNQGKAAGKRLGGWVRGKPVFPARLAVTTERRAGGGVERYVFKLYVVLFFVQLIAFVKTDCTLKTIKNL